MWSLCAPCLCGFRRVGLRQSFAGQLPHLCKGAQPGVIGVHPAILGREKRGNSAHDFIGQGIQFCAPGAPMDRGVEGLADAQPDRNKTLKNKQYILRIITPFKKIESLLIKSSPYFNGFSSSPSLVAIDLLYLCSRYCKAFSKIDIIPSTRQEC